MLCHAVSHPFHAVNMSKNLCKCVLQFTADMMCADRAGSVLQPCNAGLWVW